jgi:hypothetical protein
MAMDNPHGASISRCDEPGCNRTHVHPPAQSRRESEQDLKDAGWYWEVDYDTIRTFCETHRSQPVRRLRKGS